MSAGGLVPRAFTLVEVLVTIAVIAVLVGLLAPGLAGAREAARAVRCLAQQRQLVVAWSMYAADHADRAMPLALPAPASPFGSPGEGGAMIFWWGREGTATTPPDHASGILTAYLGLPTAVGGGLECPSQPWGSYEPQGAFPAPTSTYGYNGYFLSPAFTPGWASQIRHRPWQRLADLQRPTDLLVFADTMLWIEGRRITNNALLDPPRLFSRARGWRPNPFPTTHFRHAGRAALSARADGSAQSTPASPDWLTQPEVRIGALGTDPAPFYIPDAHLWR